MKLSTPEVRDEASRILCAVVSICNKHNITYYCEAGSVLGAVRHKGPIPWDYDADIVVPNDELDFFVECCVRELPDEYWIDYHTLPTGGYNEFPRIGKKNYSTEHLHLDVFRLIGLPDEPTEQLSLLAEASEYARMWGAFDHKVMNLLGRIKRLQFRNFMTRFIAEVTNDTSFLGKMDELCSRYPYKSAKYVLNPHGVYGAKSIFEKKCMARESLFLTLTSR